MKRAAVGNTVRVHYKGTLADGTEFDNSAGSAPMQLTIGSGEVITGVEDAIVGMTEGDTKRVTLQPIDAYGPHVPELVHVVDRNRIPAEIDLGVGKTLQAVDQSGNQMRLKVVAVSDDKVTLDANHPLAGEAITFELKLVEVVA